MTEREIARYTGERVILALPARGQFLQLCRWYGVISHDCNPGHGRVVADVDSRMIMAIIAKLEFGFSKALF